LPKFLIPKNHGSYHHRKQSISGVDAEYKSTYQVIFGRKGKTKGRKKRRMDGQQRCLPTVEHQYPHAAPFEKGTVSGIANAAERIFPKLSAISMNNSG